MSITPNFFLRCGGAGAPTAPLATPMKWGHRHWQWGCRRSSARLSRQEHHNSYTLQSCGKPHNFWLYRAKTDEHKNERVMLRPHNLDN